MAVNQILLSLIKLFIIIIPGYIFAKKDILSEEQSKGISSIVVNFTWPCLVVDSLQMAFSKKLLINSVYTVAAIAAIFIVAYCLALAARKFIHIEQNKAYLFTFMLLFANTGFMGIPVCNALYGSEGVFYAALLDSLGDIFVFTVGMGLMRKSTGNTEKTKLKEMVSPGLIALIAGITLFITDTRLPDVIGEPIGAVGSATTPLAMIIVGYQLGRIPMREFVADKTIGILAAMKLLMMPAIVFTALRLLLGDFDTFASVLAMETAMPVATCTVIFAHQYGGDAEFTAKGVVVTTLISILTIPVFAVLAGM